jgi:hypothetical protein
LFAAVADRAETKSLESALTEKGVPPGANVPKN